MTNNRPARPVPHAALAQSPQLPSLSVNTFDVDVNVSYSPPHEALLHARQNTAPGSKTAYNIMKGACFLAGKPATATSENKPQATPATLPDRT
jgi:hypothetical protein